MARKARKGQGSKSDMLALGKLMVLFIIIMMVLVYIVYPRLGADLGEDDALEPQLSAFSEERYDVSKFSSALERDFSVASIVSTPSVLDVVSDPSSCVLILVGVELPYTETEMDDIISFVKRGAGLLLADDFGFGKNLSRRIAEQFEENEKYEVGFLGSKVWGDSYYNGNSSFPLVWGQFPGQPTTYRLLFNSPTGLYLEGNQTEVIARSGNESYIDMNANGLADIGERYSIPMVVGGNLGLGKVVFISDSSFFTNELWDVVEDGTGGRVDNRAFAVDLITYLNPDVDTVIFDESRHAMPLEARIQYNTYESIQGFSSNIFFQSILILMGVIVLSLAAMAIQQEEWTHKFSVDGYHPNPNSTHDPNELEERIRYSISETSEKFQSQLKLDRDLKAFMEKSKKFNEKELTTVITKINDLMKVMRV